MTFEIESPCTECDMKPISGFDCQLHNICKAISTYHGIKKCVKEISKVELTLMHVEELFEMYFGKVQECVHQTAEDKGQWDEVVSVNEVIAHLHCEASELYKAINNGEMPSRNIPGFSHREEEAADVNLLLMSISEQLGWNLAGAIVAKAKYNIARDRT